MLITRTSPVTGLSSTLDLDVTADQIKEWENGALIQDVMPHLSPSQREFIISGCTPEDFDLLFPSED